MSANLGQTAAPATWNKRVFWRLILVQAGLMVLTIIRQEWLLLLLMPVVFLLLFALIERNPLHAIFLILFSIFFGSISNLPLASKIPQLFVVDLIFFVVVVSLVLRAIMRSDLLHISLATVEKWFLIFLGFCLLTVFKAVDPLRGLALFKNLLAGLLVFEIVLRFVKTREQIINLVQLLMFWGTVLAVIQLITMFNQGDLLETIRRKNIHLSFGSSNYIAAFYVVLIGLGLPRLFTPSLSTNKRLSLGAVIFLMLTCLFLTGSRGGVVALFVGFLVVLFRFRSLKKLLLILPFSLLVAIAIYLNPSSRIVFAGLVDFRTSASVLTRLELWLESWRLFRENPWFGVGLGNVDFHIHLKLSPVFYTKAHNLVLELLSEIGLPGFLLFAGFFAAVLMLQIRSCRRIENPTSNLLAWGFLCATLAAFVHSLFEPTITTYFFGIVFWIIIGLSVVLNRLAQNPQQGAVNE
ncbi:MAG TPA: O-antigen ligase family protein [bacterium]|nr:O-antigen ligase family protein [bacterium]HPG45012.1 O-antigen ligase family protein [bacterium]HPM97254.1 O-antigen ligase family protein [bacterium]